MTNTYRLTPRAQQDLISIGRDTLKRWGREQRFKLIAENPYMGRHRPDIKEGYYSCPEGSHVIFYLIRENGIDIIGIPHQRMDILNYFSATGLNEI
jgi:toxin ParE1/3/4